MMTNLSEYLTVRRSSGGLGGLGSHVFWDKFSEKSDTKISIYLGFHQISNNFILGKNPTNDGQDGDHCSWRHRPPAVPPLSKIYLIFLQRSKAFHWRQNRFEILQHIKNSREGGAPSTTTPPPHTHTHSCATVRVCICVYVRGLSITDKTKIANITFSTPLLILPIISFLFVLSSLHFVYIYFSIVLVFF